MKNKIGRLPICIGTYKHMHTHIIYKQMENCTYINHLLADIVSAAAPVDWWPTGVPVSGNKKHFNICNQLCTVYIYKLKIPQELGKIAFLKMKGQY